MNPLQKKCVYVTAGCHLLLLLILILGPGFFHREPAVNALPTLNVVSVRDVTDAETRGSAPTAPPPTPQPPQLQPQPTPPPVEPQPQVAPPKPVEPVTPPEQPTEEPSPVPDKPKPHVINVDITHPVDRQMVHNQPDTTQADRRAELKRERELRRIAQGLERGLSVATDVQLPGTSESAANYGQLVQSIYHNAYVPPQNAGVDAATPRVHVVIARDGTVTSAHIIERSGDAAVDASVQAVLDRVTFIHAFPEGDTESERSYNITFDLTDK